MDSLDQFIGGYIMDMGYFEAEAGVSKIVLLVMEDPAIGEFLAENLKQHSYHCEYAHDTHHALEVIESLEPDLVLLDYFNREMNGTEFLELLRSNPKSGRTPVIFMSKVPDDFLASAHKYDPVDYVAESFDADALLEKVKTVLG